MAGCRIGVISTRLLPLTLVVALVLASAAGAAGPYRFQDRPAAERGIATEFVKLEKRKKHRSYRVRSVGCAKGGVGRVYCAIVADGPDGTETFQVTVTCPDNSGKGCTIRAFDWV